MGEARSREIPSWFVASKGLLVKGRWEVIRVNYSRSITRAIKVRAKRLLITKEANLSVSLVRPSPSRAAHKVFPSCVPRPFSSNAATSRQGPPSIRLARSKFHSEFCFLNVCALRLYLSLPLAASRAPFLPRIVAPRDSRPRGEAEQRAEAARGLDISGVLSVISLVLLLPPNSPHSPTLPPS